MSQFAQLRDRITADPVRAQRLAEAEERVLAEEREYELRLSELRRAHRLTQEQVAESLHVSQAQVSRIENQADLYLSTLRDYVRALGGELELVAVFGDERVPLSLKELSAAG